MKKTQKNRKEIFEIFVCDFTAISQDTTFRTTGNPIAVLRLLPTI